MGKKDDLREASEFIIKIEIPYPILTRLLNRAYDEKKKKGEFLEDFDLTYIDLFYMPEGITAEGHGYSELRFLYKRRK